MNKELVERKENNLEEIVEEKSIITIAVDKANGLIQYITNFLPWDFEFVYEIQKKCVKEQADMKVFKEALEYAKYEKMEDQFRKWLNKKDDDEIIKTAAFYGRFQTLGYNLDYKGSGQIQIMTKIFMDLKKEGKKPEDYMKMFETAREIIDTEKRIHRSHSIERYSPALFALIATLQEKGEIEKAKTIVQDLRFEVAPINTNQIAMAMTKYLILTEKYVHSS